MSACLYKDVSGMFCYPAEDSTSGQNDSANPTSIAPRVRRLSSRLSTSMDDSKAADTRLIVLFHVYRIATYCSTSSNSTRFTMDVRFLLNFKCCSMTIVSEHGGKEGNQAVPFSDSP